MIGAAAVRLILSRKGVDSAAGRAASALVDGRPFSLPIPTIAPTPTRYGDLAPPWPALAADLTGGRLSAGRPCHLDPDLRIDMRPRTRGEGWRPALGQIGAAATHLRNQGVGAGDLFLF